LSSLLRSRERVEPVVGLTSLAGQTEPSVSPVLVREIVGSEALVYFIPTGYLTFKLQEMLPDGLHVFDGAIRIWWPGLTDRSSPLDHPLVFAGDDALGELARQFEETRPLSKRRERVLERQRSQAEERNRQLERLLQGVERDRDLALNRAIAAERLAENQGEEAQQQDTELEREDRELEESTNGLDFQGELHVLVCREWAGALGTTDRAASPLDGYRFGPEFLAGITERRVDVPLERIAWVCAMVACGLAGQLAGLDLHPMREGSGGNDPQRVRSDGARAWRCNLRRSSPGGPRLHYWVLTDGTIEFASIGYHDDYTMPGSG
jgi:hypothetical protein